MKYNLCTIECGIRFYVQSRVNNNFMENNFWLYLLQTLELVLKGR